MNRQKLAINIKPDSSEANMQGVPAALRKKQNGPTQVLMSRRIATKVRKLNYDMLRAIGLIITVVLRRIEVLEPGKQRHHI